jgi:tryptophan synthase alpha chain
MSNRYEKRFKDLKAKGEKAYIPFTILGYPNRELCLQTVKCMIDSGAAALELGIAFSDPVADGPVIQKAACETIASGFTVEDAWELVRDIRKIDNQIPIGLLVYYNMVLAPGIETFYANAAACGVDGVLIADLPPESADEIALACGKHNVAPIFIVSPLTNSERLDLILRYAKGFLYAVSRLGITGVEERYDTKLAELISEVGKRTDLPLCVGFGISTPEQAKAMLKLGAHGVITGSKIVDLVQGSLGNGGSSLDKTLGAYLTSMVKAVKEQIDQ